MKGTFAFEYSNRIGVKKMYNADQKDKKKEIVHDKLSETKWNSSSGTSSLPNLYPQGVDTFYLPWRLSIRLAQEICKLK